ncbi:MAG: DUF4012 domain-containing protein [Actinomycetia bacterium]|nr:DUF4012 domain-containing protein [Actinomycetes bacterium]
MTEPVQLADSAPEPEVPAAATSSAPDRGDGELSPSARGVRPWWVVLWLLVGLVLWLGIVGLAAREAASDARAGRDLLLSLRDRPVGTELLDDDSLRTDVGQAATLLESSRQRLDSRYMAPVQFLPILGRQFRSAQTLAVAGSDVTHALAATLDELDTIRAAPADTGTARVAQLRQLEAEMTSLRDTVDGLDLGPGEALLGELANARSQFATEMVDLGQQIDQALSILQGVGDFMEGPTTYVVLGSNNAEMRSGSGAYLSIGLLEVVGGEFELQEFTPTRETFPDEGIPVLDPDFLDRWGFVSPSEDWRRLNYTPRFDEVTGPQGALQWEQTHGLAPDGVMAVDPLVLEALLGVLDDVEIEGEVVTQENILTELFLEQYASVEYGDTPSFEESNQARSDRLSTIAGAVVGALGQPGWEPLELIDALEPVAKGRHILIWSAHERQQGAWNELGVDGSLPADTFMVSSMNWNGSKLDPFIDIDVELILDRRADSTTGQLTVTARNTVPALGDEYRYIYGPWEDLDLAQGTYGGRLVVTLPGHTSEATMGDRVLEVFGRDGSTTVIGTRYELGRGRTETFVIDFVLEGAIPALTVRPSARFPAIEWTYGDQVFADTSPYEIILAPGAG